MLTVPVMLFIMPTMFLIVGGPAAIRLMDSLKYPGSASCRTARITSPLTLSQWERELGRSR